MSPEISFGPWSTTLGLAAAFGLLVATLLTFGPGNREANRWLAALVFIVVLRMMPYVIGYAGFYDAYPWLSFAPFALTLAVGPLLWLYVWRLTGPALPPRWFAHLAPAALQCAYYSCVFVQPLAWKNSWDERVHVDFVMPIETLAAFVSLGIYLWLTQRRCRHYQAWLIANVSDRDDHRQPWIRNALVAVAVVLAVQMAFQGYDWGVARLNYFDRFPLYLVFSALVLYLGLEGWRHAAHRFPVMVAPEDSDMAKPVGAHDWSAIAAPWVERIEAESWWREPQLSLADVARRLGTNQTYVSRAINEGVGVNFNALINRMRVAAVRRSIDADGGAKDLLSVAFDAGFASKASFNRAFLDHAGMTPSAYRRRAAHVSNPVLRAISVD